MNKRTARRAILLLVAGACFGAALAALLASLLPRT